MRRSELFQRLLHLRLQKRPTFRQAGTTAVHSTAKSAPSSKSGCTMIARCAWSHAMSATSYILGFLGVLA